MLLLLVSGLKQRKSCSGLMPPDSKSNIAEKQDKPLAIWIWAFRRAQDPNPISPSSVCNRWHNSNYISLHLASPGREALGSAQSLSKGLVQNHKQLPKWQQQWAPTSHAGLCIGRSGQHTPCPQEHQTCFVAVCVCLSLQAEPSPCSGAPELVLEAHSNP